MNNKIIKTYNQYLLIWTKSWALKIASRAGIQPGKGGRGKNDDPDRRLAEQLGADYCAWLRYKTGKQIPNSSTFKVIHENAIKLGLLGQGESNQAKLEKLGPMNEPEWSPTSLEESYQLQLRRMAWEENPEAEAAKAVAILKKQIQDCANTGTKKSTD